MLKREDVGRLKREYPKGMLIRLVYMKGETAVPQGCMGTVESVDDIGQIHMKWENGSSLALNVEEDKFEILTQNGWNQEEKELGAEDFSDGQSQMMYGLR